MKGVCVCDITKTSCQRSQTPADWPSSNTAQTLQRWRGQRSQDSKTPVTSTDSFLIIRMIKNSSSVFLLAVFSLSHGFVSSGGVWMFLCLLINSFSFGLWSWLSLFRSELHLKHSVCFLHAGDEDVFLQTQTMTWVIAVSDLNTNVKQVQWLPLWFLQTAELPDDHQVWDVTDTSCWHHHTLKQAFRQTRSVWVSCRSKVNRERTPKRHRKTNHVRDWQGWSCDLWCCHLTWQRLCH